jgi:hypothetical protein
MTTTNIVRDELKRFLYSTDPEVICVTGAWGVGKTFTWQTEFDTARADKKIGLHAYSYVSLFGLNSLDGLKLAICENLESSETSHESLSDRGRRFLELLASRAARYRQLAQGIPAIGQFLSTAGLLYFSVVRSQIICIDDLERRGLGVELKDVFGLISFLREQRACKIILLLNEDGLDQDKAEFDKYFDKVIDTKLVFVPTSAEALEIALTSNDEGTALLCQYCQILRISNIRVIKKLERLVKQVSS